MVSSVLWASVEELPFAQIAENHRFALLAISQCVVALATPFNRPRQDQSDYSCLTDRQIDCLHWLAHGKTLMGTAPILTISSHTVREHLRSIMMRLNAVNTAHAIALASQLGMIGAIRGEGDRPKSAVPSDTMAYNMDVGAREAPSRPQAESNA